MRTTLRIAAVLVYVAVSTFLVTPRTASASHRYIDVDLGDYTATAYENGRAVYTAPISGGAPGFETPTGTFYIKRRVFNELMDSATIGIPRNAPGGYYLPNVMYTQYITNDGVALHGNYWRPRSVFGSRHTSHGCIGMTNADAAYFWNFATIGTPVKIHW